MSLLPSTRLRSRLALAAAAVLTATALVGAVALPADARTASTKPTIVLVHGAFSGTASWNGEVDALRHRGYSVRAITNPLRDLATDSESVADFVRTIPGPVILVGHSYGGSVITNAAAQVSNVTGLVYVDGYAPEVGETSMQLNGASSVLATKPAAQLFDQVPYPGAPSGSALLYLKLGVFDRYFGNDLPRATNERLWATQGAATNTAFAAPSAAAAWKTIPSWYFISTGDKIVTPASMRSMAARAGSHVTVFRGGSHLTLISHPAAVVKTILKAVRGSR